MQEPIFFDNPKSSCQNQVLLDNVSLSLNPGEDETKTMSSACCNAGYSVRGDDTGWLVADASKNLDMGLRFIGENDRIINEFLKKEEPRETRNNCTTKADQTGHDLVISQR